MTGFANLTDTRILVVEDDPDYAEWIELALEVLKVAEIVKAPDGEAALALVESQPPFDLIVCDWLMPKMNGLDFLKRYREKVASSLFLVLTAKDGLEDAFEAIQAGATNYLVKPVTVEKLRDAVASMLRSGATAA